MKMDTTILMVPDISCEHCEHAITQALTPLDGVDAVKVDIPAKTVTVTHDASQVSIDQIKDVLSEEDYPVASVG
jgi:copper chaperone